jgi:hypothetical protein
VGKVETSVGTRKIDEAAPPRAPAVYDIFLQKTTKSTILISKGKSMNTT